MLRILRGPGGLLAAAILVGAVIFGALRLRGPTVRVATAVRRDLEQHVVASGRVWVPTRVQIAAQVAGLVIAVAATEGQRVKAGSLLVQIDDAEERAAAAQAKAAVDQAKARVEQLRRVGAIVATEALRQADTNLDQAETELARIEKLAASGAVAPVELEDARRSVEVARAQKATAEAQRIASAPMGADSRIALTALLQAEAQLAGANARLAQTRIVALQDGTVLTRSVETGDVVQPSRTLLVMAADGDTLLVFHPDERNLASIALGQHARASADAYPEQIFDAYVSYIAPSIDAQRGSIEVRLRVPNPPPNLKPDMTVSVDLTVAAKTQALTLPSEAVRGASTPSPWVAALEGGHVVRKEVKVGLRGEGAMEMISGIAEGAIVAIPDGRLLTPGQRVRAERD